MHLCKLQVHPVEEYQDIINLTVDGLNECEIVMPTRRRWALNYSIAQCTGNSITWGSDELEIRCGRENQHPERLGLRLSSPGEWERNAVMATQPFQIKWEVYFSKNCVARIYCVVIMILHTDVHACICVCIVGHGCDNTTNSYSTGILNAI